MRAGLQYWADGQELSWKNETIDKPWWADMEAAWNNGLGFSFDVKLKFKL